MGGCPLNCGGWGDSGGCGGDGAVLSIVGGRGRLRGFCGGVGDSGGLLVVGGSGAINCRGGEVGVVGMGLSPSIDNGRLRGVCAGQCVTV